MGLNHVATFAQCYDHTNSTVLCYLLELRPTLEYGNQFGRVLGQDTYRGMFVWQVQNNIY